MSILFQRRLSELEMKVKELAERLAEIEKRKPGRPKKDAGHRATNTSH